MYLLKPHRSLVLFSTLLAFSIAAPANAAQQTNKFYADLLFSDLIVRGHVSSVTSQGVPTSEFDPDWSGPDGYFGILFIDIEVEEVIRGYLDAPRLTFLVHADRSDLRGDYNADSEVVVGLVFMPRFRNGTYALNMRDARFVRVGDSWAAGGDESALVSIDEIRAAVAPTTVDAAARSAESVFIGRVTNSEFGHLPNPNDPSDYGIVRMLTVQVERVLKGNATVGERRVRCFSGGSYWPKWAGRGPNRIIVGASYCFLASNVDGIPTVIGGANGLYQLGEDGSLLHNELPTPVKVPTLEKMMENSK